MTGYGVPSAAPPPTPSPSGQTTAGQPLFELIGAGLGFLSFIWGFVDFYSGTKGYSLGTTAVGLSIAAGAIAGAVLLSEKADPTRPPDPASHARLAAMRSGGAAIVASLASRERRRHRSGTARDLRSELGHRR